MGVCDKLEAERALDENSRNSKSQSVMGFSILTAWSLTGFSILTAMVSYRNDASCGGGGHERLCLLMCVSVFL